MFLVFICYVRLLALSCPKNFSAQSELVLFCAPDNKNLKLNLETIYSLLVRHLAAGFLKCNYFVQHKVAAYTRYTGWVHMHVTISRGWVAISHYT